MRRLALAGVVVAGTLAVGRLSTPADPCPNLPRLMLWAWESPQDLRFVPPGSAGIAFLARTVWLGPEGARSHPRLQPMRYQPGTDLMAVVRLESAGRGLPARDAAIREVLPAARLEGIRAIQIDFDARKSERGWYAGFLRDLRAELPAEMPLTITALESWCDGDNWLSGLPLDDATPMLFRMGAGERVPEEFSSAVCRNSIGVSSDEVPSRVPRGRRVYYFHPGAWTEAAYLEAAAQAGRWQR